MQSLRCRQTHHRLLRAVERGQRSALRVRRPPRSKRSDGRRAQKSQFASPCKYSVKNIPDDARRLLFKRMTRFLDLEESVQIASDVPPRLTMSALEALRMSRSRERILANLEEMYREAFERAQQSDDPSAMAQLDFAYRREQLYFEILLDVRDAMEKR